MNSIIVSILVFILGLIIGGALIFGFGIIKRKRTESLVESMIETAKKEADKLKRDSILEYKEEIHHLKMETDKEIKEKKSEIKENEDRLLQRENNIDRRDITLQNREEDLSKRENKLLEHQKEIQEKETKIEEIKKQQLEKLEIISKYTKEQAHEEILKSVEASMNKEIALYIKECEAEAKLEADAKAKEMIVGCMQRYAADVTNNQTVSVISLPNDEMKGRIIGREGRNVRTIECVEK